MSRSEAEEVRAHVEAFRRVCADSPAGEVRPSNDGVEPDIIVVGDRVVGIEHTRFVRANAAGVPVQRIQEGERERVVRKARRGEFQIASRASRGDRSQAPVRLTGPLEAEEGSLFLAVDLVSMPAAFARLVDSKPLFISCRRSWRMPRNQSAVPPVARRHGFNEGQPSELTTRTPHTAQSTHGRSAQCGGAVRTHPVPSVDLVLPDRDRALPYELRRCCAPPPMGAWTDSLSRGAVFAF